MPGVEFEQLYRAMQLADRVSVNLEGPTQERLSALAPKKDFMGELLRMLEWAETIRQENQLLSISNRLYRQMGLTRAYYSGFSPVEQTPFENLAPTDPLREHRLYQASFLLRDYGWGVEDLSFLEDGNLRTDIDPKRAWAERYLRAAPVDVMKADRRQLLRVPGIGPKGADAILRVRRLGRLTELAHLRQLNIRAPEQAAPYILLDGHRPAMQMRLF